MINKMDEDDADFLRAVSRKMGLVSSVNQCQITAVNLLALLKVKYDSADTDEKVFQVLLEIRDTIIELSKTDAIKGYALGTTMLLLTNMEVKTNGTD